MAHDDPKAGRVPTLEVIVTEPVISATLPWLTLQLAEALRVRPVHLVVDLSACPAIDAAGIGLLVDAHRRMRREGGYLTVRAPSAHLRRNLSLAHTDHVLDLTPPSA